MSDTDNKPWYKRAWLAVAAVLAAVFTFALTLVMKQHVAKKKLSDAQKEDQKVLDERLADKVEVKDAKLEAIDAKKEAAEEKASSEHEARKDAITEKANSDAAAVPADGVPAALLDSLNSADKKLS